MDGRRMRPEENGDPAVEERMGQLVFWAAAAAYLIMMISAAIGLALWLILALAGAAG